MLVLLLAMPALAWAEAVTIGARLELLVDDQLIAAMPGVRLKLHEPRSRGTVLTFDRPWEGNVSGSGTVFRDGDLYRMYYRAGSAPELARAASLQPGETLVPAHPEFTCYAESKDGITWTKPALGLFEFGGSKENNIVWAGEASHNFSPFRDDNPETPPEERYKAVGNTRDHLNKKYALMGFVSPDGKRWRTVREKPIISDGRFDSLNVVFWDAIRRQYTAIYRTPYPERSGTTAYIARSIKFSRSKDFLEWEPGRVVDFGDAPVAHIYTNATVPYFRAPHHYLALPRRFHPWRTYFEDFEQEHPGVSDAIFMSSRDGVRWHRFEDAFIRPGRDERAWVHRSNEPFTGIVPTGPDEISIYVQRHYTFPSIHVERFTLRTDGFVSAHAGSAGGELTTKPLVFAGSRLVLNYATAAGGSIRLEIQDEAGRPLPGYALEESPLLFGDQVEAAVKWKNDRGYSGATTRLESLAGTPVRLRFVLRDADLYSFQFR
ncbi:MAG: hypothetical protein JNG83_06930 [Opitutaceae bacterium]|nr:hypothetical protein [Opitutaceae bacterium]